MWTAAPNVLVFTTNPVDLKDDGSLTDCSYVNGGLEVPGDLVAVEQDIDVSLKLLTTHRLYGWAQQHHSLQNKVIKHSLSAAESKWHV